MSSTDQNRHGFRQNFGRVGHYAKGTFGDFRTFILRGNVVDLAIGIVIGGAFTAVVNALVSDIITPLIPVSKTDNLSTSTISLGYATLHIGAFLNAVLTFLIVALVLYFFVVRPVSALLARYRPKEVEVPVSSRDCPYCLQAIPLQATRCAFCTSLLPPIDANADASIAR